METFGNFKVTPGSRYHQLLFLYFGQKLSSAHILSTYQSLLMNAKSTFIIADRVASINEISVFANNLCGIFVFASDLNDQLLISADPKVQFRSRTLYRQLIG